HATKPATFNLNPLRNRQKKTNAISKTWGAMIMALLVLFAASCSNDDEAFVQGPTFLDLPTNDLFPEGILESASGDLYVTGFGNATITGTGNGSILRITNGETIEFFKNPAEDGLSSAVGMAIDEARNRLWVANFDFATFNSNMKVFDLNSGNLLATLTPPTGGHFFNEVAIDESGRVYISDTTTPTIWTADADLDSVYVFAQDDLLSNPDPNRPFGQNGLAITADGDYLIASIMDRIDQGDGRLVRIDISSRSVSEVTLTGDATTIAQFGGSDGMFFEPTGLLMMVNVTPPSSIVTAEFNADFSSASLVSRTTFELVYNRPTASAILNGRLWTVNSQLDHVIDDENGAVGTPADIPFQLVNVSLNETLGR
ncbi:MAG: hypothetical protein AAFX87_28485, partial [Bacteroidota bacterium]